jgi:hypothetical protein
MSGFLRRGQTWNFVGQLAKIIAPPTSARFRTSLRFRWEGKRHKSDLGFRVGRLRGRPYEVSKTSKGLKPGRYTFRAGLMAL